MNPEAKAVKRRRMFFFPLIEPYFKEGHDAVQIGELLLQNQGVELTPDQISKSIAKARQAGKIPPLTGEQVTDLWLKGKTGSGFVIRSTPGLNRQDALDRSSGKTTGSATSLEDEEQIFPVTLSPEARTPHAIAVSRGKGGVSIALGPYFLLGMTAAEARAALQFEQGLTFEVTQARDARRKAISRKIIRVPSNDEKEDSLQNCLLTDDQIAANARLWVGAVKATKESHLGTRDWTRIDWKNWILENQDKAREMQLMMENPQASALRARNIKIEDIEILIGDTEIVEEHTHIKNRMLLARKLVGANFVSEDTVAWNFAKDLATRENKRWFDNSFDAINMEVYLRAVAEEYKGRRASINLYMQLGNSIDLEWFRSDRMREERNLVKYKAIPLADLISLRPSEQM